MLDEDQEIHRTTDLKALFRCSKALVALERLDDAKDALARYFSKGGKADEGIKKLSRELDDRITYRNKIAADRAERQRRQEAEDEVLSKAIKVLI